MNRLQKKCFFFSLGLHGLVALVLLVGPGFRSRPQPSDLQIMTMIPARILDRAGAGGGSPAVTVSQPLPPAPTVPVQPQPQPQPQRQVVPTPPVERPQPPTPRQPEEVERPAPEPRPSEDLSLEPKEKPHKPRHEIQPTYTPASEAKITKKTDKEQSRENQAREAAERAQRAEARRLREIQESLGQLAKNVKSSGDSNATVDVSGIGGGEAFASYRNVIFNAYYHAWITPDSITDRSATADAKVNIARDGSIRSAEVVRASGDSALDKSVERALRRVTQLPPFPASARDEERTFTIHFSLEAKETSG
jgi:protein TonB